MHVAVILEIPKFYLKFKKKKKNAHPTHIVPQIATRVEWLTRIHMQIHTRLFN